MTLSNTDLVLERLNDVTEQLRKIEEHTAKTNGRVTAIEQSRAVEAAIAQKMDQIRAAADHKREKFFDRLPDWLVPFVGFVAGTVASQYIH